MFSILLLMQVATVRPDTATYSSDALRTVVAEASRLNQVPPSLGRYRVEVETEISIGIRDGGGTEIGMSVEQFASQVTWGRNDEFTHHITGFNTPGPLSMAYSVGLLNNSWVVPSLYGNRLQLSIPDSTQPGRSRPAPTTIAVHPLADDRDRFYRYTGGDTIEVLRIDDREIRIVRVNVEPRADAPARAVVFGGELDLDADRKYIVRLRGSFYVVGAPPPGIAGSIARSVGHGLLDAIGFFEFVNAEVEKEFWLPQYQRREVLIRAPIIGESREFVRIVSQFRNFTISSPENAAAVTTVSVKRAHPPLITFAPPDSIGRYRDWQRPLGAATTAVRSDDFDDIGPERWRAGGPPLVVVQAEHRSDVVRFNPIEGLFTGLGVAAKFRDAAPGVTLRATTGYAWSEHTVRGRASAELKRDAWTYAVRGGRSLDHTNDFGYSIDSGSTLSSLLGIDDHDYVDRYTEGVSVIRAPPKRASLMRVELGWARDRAVTRHVEHEPFGRDPFHTNRGVDEGNYLRSAFTLQWNPNALGISALPGIGASLSYLRGDGDLNFQRVEVRVIAHRYAGPWTVFANAAGGMLFGPPPPQQLFEIGGEHGLPGYEYKEFAGDRAAVVNGTVMYRFNILTSPIMTRRTPFLGQFMFPGIAPALRVVASAGWTGVSGDAARDAIARLGPRDPLDPHSASLNAPASVPTGNPRVSIGAGLVFFGGIVRITVARAIDHNAPWKLQVGY